MIKVKIKRDSGYADSLRVYKIVLDRNVIGTVKDGEEITFEVSKGTHELYLKIDWGRSNIINFDTNDNDAEFECGSSLRGFKILLSIFYITFFRNQYIWLKKTK